MRFKTEPERVVFTELTEPQWQAARTWFGKTIINSEFWEHDHTKVVLHKPTDKQMKDFTALVEVAR